MLYGAKSDKFAKQAADQPTLFNGLFDQAKYDALMADQNEKFKLSILYMERANEIALDNGGTESKRAILDALKSLYYRTGDFDKSSQMAEELKAL